MFDRTFQLAMALSARLLFGASVIMLVASIGYAVRILSNVGMTGPSLAQQEGWPLALTTVVFSSFLPAAYLFAASAAVHHLSRLGRDSTSQV